MEGQICLHQIHSLIISITLCMQGECTSYPLCLVYWKDLAWIDLTEPSPLDLAKIRVTVSPLEAAPAVWRYQILVGVRESKEQRLVSWYWGQWLKYCHIWIWVHALVRILFFGKASNIWQRLSKSEEVQEDPLLRHWEKVAKPWPALLGGCDDCGVSGGCRAAQGMGINELV